jgi:hypothetical protein
MVATHISNDVQMHIIPVVNKATTQLMCFTPTETVLGTIGRIESVETRPFTHKIPVYTELNEWSIPVTKNLGVGVEMPIELENREDVKFLDYRFDFTVFRAPAYHNITHYPSITAISVVEDIVVNGQIRPPREPGEEPGNFRVAGTGSAGGRVVIIDEDTWEVEHTRLVSEGSYEVPGLQSGLKLVISRKSDGESVAYGAVEAVPEE